jgi:hypothetical protein
LSSGKTEEAAGKLPPAPVVFLSDDFFLPAQQGVGRQEIRDFLQAILTVGICVGRVLAHYGGEAA